MPHQCNVPACWSMYEDFTGRIRNQRWRPVDARALLFACEWLRDGNKTYNEAFGWAFCYETFNQLRASHLIYVVKTNRTLDAPV